VMVLNSSPLRPVAANLSCLCTEVEGWGNGLGGGKGGSEGRALHTPIVQHGSIHGTSQHAQNDMARHSTAQHSTAHLHSPLESML